MLHAVGRVLGQRLVFIDLVLVVLRLGGLVIQPGAHQVGMLDTSGLLLGLDHQFGEVLLPLHRGDGENEVADLGHQSLLAEVVFRRVLARVQLNLGELVVPLDAAPRADPIFPVHERRRLLLGDVVRPGHEVAEMVQTLVRGEH